MADCSRYHDLDCNWGTDTPPQPVPERADEMLGVRGVQELQWPLCAATGAVGLPWVAEAYFVSSSHDRMSCSSCFHYSNTCSLVILKNR